MVYRGTLIKIGKKNSLIIFRGGRGLNAAKVDKITVGAFDCVQDFFAYYIGPLHYSHCVYTVFYCVSYCVI